MHEIRYGELAHFKLIPHTPYYGTADATLLYLIVLHSAWRATGDPGLFEHHLETAEESSPGLTDMAIVTATAFRNTPLALRSAMRTMGWEGCRRSSFIWMAHW